MTLSKTELSSYGEFFFTMLKKLAAPSCKHCHGRGTIGVQLGSAKNKKGDKQATGWDVFCHGKSCVGKTLGRYLSEKKKFQSRKVVVIK